MSTTAIVSLVYALVGGGSAGATYLNFRDNFSAYTQKFGKKTIWAIVGILVAVWPASLAIGVLMYLGKTKEAELQKVAQEAEVTEAKSE